MFDDKYSPSPVRIERINKPKKSKEEEENYIDPIGDALEGRKLHGIGFDRTSIEEAARLKLLHYRRQSL